MVNDKTDEKIIEFLRNDARESFVEIGKETETIRICSEKTCEKFS